MIINDKKIINYLIFLLISFYCLISIVVSLHRYWQYSSFYLDLGLYDQAIWRVSKFQIPLIDHIRPQTSGKIIFADHFNPSLFLLSPIYWITDKSEALLILQAVFVSLSGFIFYKTSKKLIKSKLIRFSLLCSYLGFVGLQNALITDFHDTTILLLPLSIYFWAVINKKWKTSFLMLLLILGLKETMAGLGMGLGIYIFLKGKSYRKIGLITALISIIWGILAAKFVIPYFSKGLFFYQPEFPANLETGIQSFFYPWIKTKTLFLSFATFGFLPLFYLPILPVLLEHFLERFVLQSSATRWDLGFHYNAQISPLLFIGAVEIISFLKMEKKFPKILKIWAIFTVLIVLFLHRFYLNGPLQLFFQPAFYETTKNTAFLNDFVKIIPVKGLLMTQPHLTTRFTHYCVISFKDNYSNYAPDFIALETRKGQNPANFFPYTEDKIEKIILKIKKDPNYKLIFHKNDQYIFSRIEKNKLFSKYYCYN